MFTDIAGNTDIMANDEEIALFYYKKNAAFLKPLTKKYLQSAYEMVTQISDKLNN